MDKRKDIMRHFPAFTSQMQRIRSLGLAHRRFGAVLYEMIRKLTPQEKKRLSYLRNCRNCYGENAKASRKAIFLRKRWVNRAYRRSTQQIVSVIKHTKDTDDIECGGWGKPRTKPRFDKYAIAKGQ
jgi:hypothetical protein